jgi:hypothetical protein
VLTVTTEMVEGARASWEDIEGMVNWGRNAEGRAGRRAADHREGRRGPRVDAIAQ